MEDQVISEKGEVIYAGKRNRVLGMLAINPGIRERAYLVFDCRKSRTISVDEYLILSKEEKKEEVAALIRGFVYYSQNNDFESTDLEACQLIDTIQELMD